ncbi:MAG: DUF2784 domain-containing protein [Acidobacteria bacterium]|jgi:hypothetical protein|nr:DUF2784 domain-containing protein [Acidobacteriota bacterium]HEV8158064.1 DUF2784 domain-containing protein [Pyrinomonadaceae bacterium]
MAYRILADLVLTLHFCFVLFVVFGGLLALRRRWVASLHLPAVVWGVLVECFFWACPLTTLENSLRQLGGESGYTDGFIDHYVSAILYARISPQFRITLGLLLIGLNLLVYWYVFRRRFSPLSKME